MARLEKTARTTISTATDALNTAAQAVKVGRKAVRTARKAGSQAKVVVKQAFDRVTGREAARRKKVIAIAAGVTGAAIVTGVAAVRVRRMRKR